jgi:hypothetical protein
MIRIVERMAVANPRQANLWSWPFFLGHMIPAQTLRTASRSGDDDTASARHTMT